MKNGIGIKIARVIIFILAGIHIILPFTPVNQHPEQFIIIAALILGALYLFLGIRSFKEPFSSVLISFIILCLTIIVSDLTQRSPLSEGLLIKVFFIAGLLYGLLDIKRINNKKEIQA